MCISGSSFSAAERDSPAAGQGLRASRGEIELGRPEDWVREGALGSARAPVARTAADQWLALFSHEDVLIGAVSRWCPHRGADLLDHAAYHECPGALSCRHAGYSWWLESGAVRTRGEVGDSAHIEIHPVHVRADGSAYIVLPANREC